MVTLTLKSHLGQGRRLPGSDSDHDLVPERLVNLPVQAQFGDASVPGVPLPVRTGTTKQPIKRINRGFPEIQPVAPWAND